MLTTTPGAVAGNGITPVSCGGVYGKTLVNPDFNDFAPRVGFAYAVDPKTAIRGGFGISYVALHARRLGRHPRASTLRRRSLPSVRQIAPTTTNHCSTPLPAQIIAIGHDDALAATPPPTRASPAGW